MSHLHHSLSKLILKRIKRRQRRYGSPSQGERFRPLVPAPTPPAFQRPSTENRSTIQLNSELAEDFVTFPRAPQAVGNTFRLKTANWDLYYRVRGFEVSFDGKTKFHVQFEGAEYVTKSSPLVADTHTHSRGQDIFDLSGLTHMLRDSELVTSE